MTDGKINSEESKENPPLHPLPDFGDETSTVEWLKRVVPAMDEHSRYRKNLERALMRHEFRQQRIALRQQQIEKEEKQ